MTELHNRRATDVSQDKILVLIEQADDPKDRAFLIVLQQINESLIANTHIINEVAEKLDNHLTAYEAHTEREQLLLNQGKGMWRVAARVLGAIQAIAIVLISFAFNEIVSIKKDVSDISAWVKVHDAKEKAR
jgi:hypothetical protein